MQMKNEMILASAGSGKTWQLTNRYIAIMGRDLLAGKDPKPESILAVTFTRKAAGEFFDEILKKLAQGASSEEAAQAIAGRPNDAQNPLYEILVQLSQPHYQELLVLFIQRMPRLFLGTLDSLFANIVRSFPAEFGLTGGFEILNEHDTELARNEVLQQVFNGTKDAAEQGEFIEAFRLATLGKQEASVQRLLNRFIGEHHNLLLAAASPALWGNESLIWPEGNPWLQENEDAVPNFEKLYALFDSESFSVKQTEFWDEFRLQLPLTTPGKLPKRVEFFLNKFLQAWDEIVAGEVTLSVSKKQKMGPEECALIQKITLKLMGDQLRHHLIRTRGIWAILAQYETTYARQVRRKGKLTFHDLEVLLAGSPDSPRPILAQGPGPDGRLRLDYRLDSRFDHWLLDEFQDTSYLQWSVIEGLVDEAVADPSGERSLFQVGDIKQAIYAWRGGDTKLFGDIARRYSQGSDRAVHLRDLSVSYRSGEDVILPLNDIFGNREALKELGFPEEACEQWQWQPHQVADKNKRNPGLTAYYHPEPSEGEKVVNEDCHALTLALLEEIQPIAKGLSCVILVQNNKEGREIVDYVRTHSPSKIPIVSESDVAIAQDNPVTLAFLNLFHLAAHPEDLFAQGHLEMSPLQTILTQQEITLAQLTSLIRRQVNQLGFEATLRHWMQLAQEENLLENEFSKQRLEDLALAARTFDQSGNLSLDRFVNYARSYTLREPNSKSAVQVMTIHKSKGLTYDMAILPQLGGDPFTKVRNGMGVQRDRESRAVEWIFDLPNKAIATSDEMLMLHHTHLEAEAAYERLCKFYVALTRARYANYLIAPPLGPRSKSRNFLKLLNDTLVDPETELESDSIQGVPYQCAYESNFATSDPRWWEKLAPKEKAITPVERPAKPKLAPRPRPARKTPSRPAQNSDQRRAFSARNQQALEIGSAVHALLESLSWWDPQFKIPNNPAYPQEAYEHVERVLADAHCQQNLQKPTLSPGERAVIWREQSFEILLDGAWTSGILDRAHIIYDESGQALSAHIIDYKTDRVMSDEEAEQKAQSYRNQMTSYRTAVASLLGLSLGQVTASLLFTSLPCFIDLNSND